ncbi:hypothetical protein MMC26_004852 [Xylographa opegraphella]|nr:hypothetical protein [Xylographa opegraphella]
MPMLVALLLELAAVVFMGLAVADDEADEVIEDGAEDTAGVGLVVIDEAWLEDDGLESIDCRIVTDTPLGPIVAIVLASAPMRKRPMPESQQPLLMRLVPPVLEPTKSTQFRSFVGHRQPVAMRQETYQDNTEDSSRNSTSSPCMSLG